MTEEKVNNIIKMLKSENEEDHVVGLSILEQMVDITLVELCLCLKFSKCKFSYMEEHMPSKLEELFDIDKTPFTRAHLTWSRIVSQIKNDNDKALIKSFIEQDWTQQLKTAGNDFIKSITIEI